MRVFQKKKKNFWKMTHSLKNINVKTNKVYLQAPLTYDYQLDEQRVGKPKKYLNDKPSKPKSVV